MSNASIAKNYFFSVLHKIVNIIIPLISIPYLSRVIGAEGIGVYAYYYAIAHFFYIFGKMGLNNYGTREIADAKEDQEKINYTFTSIFIQQVISGSLFLIIYMSNALYSYFNSGDNLISLILGLYVMGCLFDIDWLYFGLRRFDKIAVKNISIRIITLCSIFVFVKSSSDLWIYSVIMSLSMLLGIVIYWFDLRKYAKFTKVTLSSIVKHIKPNFVLLFPVIAVNIYCYVDKLMLGYVSGMVSLGYYENANKIICAIAGFISAFVNVMLPVCTNLISDKNSEKCIWYLDKSMQFLFFIIMMMSSVIFGLSEKVVLIILGKSFEESIIVVKLLLVTLFFTTWSNVIRSLWVIPNRKDWLFILSVSISAIINFLVNLILIPIYGVIGACIGTIVAEFIVPIVQYIFLKGELDYCKLIKNQYIFIISWLVTTVTLISIEVFFQVTAINLIILMIGGSIIYICCVLFLYFIFKLKEFNQCKLYIKNKYFDLLNTK